MRAQAGNHRALIRTPLPSAGEELPRFLSMLLEHPLIFILEQVGGDGFPPNSFPCPAELGSYRAKYLKGGYNFI